MWLRRAVDKLLAAQEKRERKTLKSPGLRSHEVPRRNVFRMVLGMMQTWRTMDERVCCLRKWGVASLPDGIVVPRRKGQELWQGMARHRFHSLSHGFIHYIHSASPKWPCRLLGSEPPSAKRLALRLLRVRWHAAAGPLPQHLGLGQARPAGAAAAAERPKALLGGAAPQGRGADDEALRAQLGQRKGLKRARELCESQHAVLVLQ